jgi:hypothetical protein
MNGKGSKRRPALVTDEVVKANWENTFGNMAKNKQLTKAWVCTCPRPRTKYSHLGDFEEREAILASY